MAPLFKVSCPLCGDNNLHTAKDDAHSLEVHNAAKASRHKEFEDHVAKYTGGEKKN